MVLTTDETTFLGTFPESKVSDLSEEDWVDEESENIDERAPSEDVEQLKEQIATNLRAHLLNLVPSDVAKLQGSDGSGESVPDESGGACGK